MQPAPGSDISQYRPAESATCLMTEGQHRRSIDAKSAQFAGDGDKPESLTLEEFSGWQSTGVAWRDWHEHFGK
jgi:hypothetical protein